MLEVEGGEEKGIKVVVIEGEERLCTRNLVEGSQVYGEQLISIDGVEYRVWDPFRSKLAAAIIKGLRHLPIDRASRVLYLGASTGTTVSHISDIAYKGIVYAVESAPRVARELIERVAKHRRNVIPIVEDARRYEHYPAMAGKVDIIYCDIAQQDQTDIAVANAKAYLKDGGYLMLVVKTRSIDVTKEPSSIVEEEVAKLRKNGFSIEKVIYLEPFDKDHAMVIARYKL
ncbi:MAG: fibrillarin-like rRNA/tRNA 2'-O-methyltransferase [Candidatus Nitrosocaldus sp.]